MSSWYLDPELWTGDVELLRRQEALLGGRVLQHDGQVDHVVSHHVLVLGGKDVLLDNLGCRRVDGKRSDSETAARGQRSSAALASGREAIYLPAEPVVGRRVFPRRCPEDCGCTLWPGR